ncbi:hypothetical protein LPJ62_003450 [Coemansia sp. RSA 2167]|nr:hypothetical protein LPJ62_003450 [Coemansia sp. RSA 2167]
MAHEDTAATPGRSKRPRKSTNYAAESSDAESPGHVKEECLRLYKAVKEMESNGELMCVAFNKLPPKKEYPDYYVEIKKPIALDIIKGKITRGVYGRVSDIVADFDLMCNNAQQYNIPDSYIYDIAGEMRKNIHELAAASISENEPTSPTPQLKLRIRQSTSDQGDDSPPTTAEVSKTPQTKAKRKRPQYTETDSDEDSESKPKAVAKSGARSGSSADQALDDLFQAIYDADLGKAIKLLELPELPMNDYRKVVLREQETEEGDLDNFTWAPLHAAACYGRLKVAQLLCRRGAQVEIVDTMHKSTPLAWAAYTGRKRLAKFLVREFKANVNARNAHGQLPIEIAVDPGHPMWSEFLLPTDGTQIDLPPPEVQETAEPKNTPAKKTKTRMQDAPTPTAMPMATASSQMIGMLPSTPLTPSQPAAQMPGIQVPQSQPMPLNGPVVPQCIGGIGHQEAVHPQMTTAMKEIIAQLDELKDSEGERMIEPFEELPDREEYPEYYEVISYPMALALVKKRIDGYRSFDAFNYDMLWIFNNATFFNEPESEIYNTAVNLEKTYKRLCRDAVQKHQIPFDMTYNDAEASDGRLVSRITVGDHDLFVGDFFYMRNGATKRVGMVTRLRVSGPGDRRKFIDGFWLLTPSEVPEIAGQAVYPHQLFAGLAFEALGVRGVQGKCFVLLPNVYARVYPQGFAAQDVYVCETAYVPSAGPEQPATFRPLTNWAHEFKTPLMKPPAFIPYIVPFTPQKQPLVQWNNVSLLPNLAMTVLNREAAARMQNQARARQTQSATQSPGMQQAALGQYGTMRSPGTQPQQQPNYTQAHQSLMLQFQQAQAKAQAQLNQQKAGINKQASDQIVAAQQQNASFVGSPGYQTLLKQQAQLIEQAQQAFNSQVQMLQQSYNQQAQSLNQAQQQLMQQTQQTVQNLSPLSAQQSIGGAGMVPMSPGIGQMSVASPVARTMQPTMMTMSPMQPMAGGANGMPFSVPGVSMAGVNMTGVSMTGSPHMGMVRPGLSMSPMPMGAMSDASFGASAAMLRPGTPSRAPTGTPILQPGISSPMQAGSNAQAMMAMLLQQQQMQQMRQQQPSTPKQTHLPLSPDLTSPNGQTPAQTLSQQTLNQQNLSQQMFEQWTKSTRVFLTHGNSRIERGCAMQLATPNASMFMHLALNDGDVNHAVQVPKSSSSVLIRPVPGPFTASGKALLALTVNGRACLPRIIPLDGAQASENGMSDDTPSHASDEADKDEMALVKNSNYAYEVPLQVGMNAVGIEAVAAEWLPEHVSNDASDQQVPPGTPVSPDAQRSQTKHFLLFLTRQ